MTKEELDNWKALTSRMVRDPQPGDYFTDHMCPVALIEKRNGEEVKVKKVTFVDGEREWTAGKWMPVGEFIKWVSYGDIPGFWVEGHRSAQPQTDKEA